MVDYRKVKNPAALKAIPFATDDILLLGRAQQVNIGVNKIGPELPTQLNIRHADNMTFVQPIGDGNKVLPWKFSGYVSPHDCLTWFEATLTPPTSAARSAAAKAIAETASKAKLLAPSEASA